MADKYPLIIRSNGSPGRMRLGDTVPVEVGGTGVASLAALKTAMGLDGVGGNTYYDITVDFGTIPTDVMSFSIANALALTTSHIFAQAKADSDEYELDTLLCNGYCEVDGTVIIIVRAIPGPVSGTKNITYWLG